jgi:hypothetical protein
VVDLLTNAEANARTWSDLQVRLGGRVHPDELRRAVDSLLESGEAIEVWDVFNAHDRRQPRHIVALTDRAPSFAWREIIDATGRLEALHALCLRPQ